MSNHILKTHSRILTCPTLLYFIPAFLISTILGWLSLYWENKVLIQCLCYHHSNPMVIMLIPHFTDLKLSVTVVAQLIQTQIIFLALYTFSWAFVHFVLQTHVLITSGNFFFLISCFLPFYHYICDLKVEPNLFWLVMFGVKLDIRQVCC